MMAELWFEVDGYRLSSERYYHEQSHFWVEVEASSARARIGFDPLGRETRGDIVELSILAVGTELRRGQPFGSVEAAKFVGPLETPMSGRILSINSELLAGPRLLNEDPMSVWLIELELADLCELADLLHGEDQVRPWFAAELERYRRMGVVAE